MDRLGELKGKYQSVLRIIEQLGVRLQNVHVQDNKLLIRGQAGSEETKNRVWDQVKLVDPSYSDLICDITVDSSLAPAEAATTEQIYEVKPGDTLSKISQQFYGSTNKYMKIFEANRDQLDDPNKIRAGQVLKIPT